MLPASHKLHPSIAVQISSEYLLKKIAQAGVVGAGGAGFPAQFKLNQPVEQVIANGAECEPLLASDKTLLKNYSPQVIKGLLLSMAATQASQGIIAVKKRHSRLVKILQQQITSSQLLRLHLLDDFYPAGDEHILTYEVTGKRIPPGQFPPSVGVVVHNVTTLKQIAAAFDGQPVTSRYVTVTGQVRQPVVIKTPIGTPLRDLVHAAGGSPLNNYRIIVGGPMMGQLAADPRQESTSKTTAGILVVSPHHWLVRRNQANPQQQLQRVKAACDNCRMCTDFCPRYLLGHPLEPHLSMQALSHQQLEVNHLLDAARLCCLCGICEIVACPCNLSPRALYQALKKSLAQQELEPAQLKTQAVRAELQQRRIPLTKLYQRLQIREFTRVKPKVLPRPFLPKRVRINLKQHVGAKADPIVKKGQRVTKGQMIAAVPKDKLGANIHASVTGVVTGVDANWVEIVHSTA